MQEDERDIVVFSDDEGNDFELEVIDYFFYNGQEYAVLTDPEDECDCDCGHDHEHGEDCDCEHGHEHDVYIMKVVELPDGMEEFLPVEDDLMETLVQIAQTRFDGDAEDEDFDDDEEDEEEDDK